MHYSSHQVSISNSSYQRPDLRFRLRDETDHYHEQLNAHPLMLTLMQPQSLLSHYHQVLCAYFKIYQLLENRILQFLNVTSCSLDCAQRMKLPWLKQDIQFFNLEVQLQGTMAEQAEMLAKINTMGDLIGVVYILEGATLGGQFISRSLLKNHGLSAIEWARFFNGYGEASSRMWKSFIDFLPTLHLNQTESDAAILAACQTFQLFIQMLDEPPLELHSGHQVS